MTRVTRNPILSHQTYTARANHRAVQSTFHTGEWLIGPPGEFKLMPPDRSISHWWSIRDIRPLGDLQEACRTWKEYKNSHQYLPKQIGTDPGDRLLHIVAEIVLLPRLLRTRGRGNAEEVWLHRLRGPALLPQGDTLFQHLPEPCTRESTAALKREFPSRASREMCIL